MWQGLCSTQMSALNHRPLDTATALAALDMTQIWFWLALVYLKALALFGYISDIWPLTFVTELCMNS